MDLDITHYNLEELLNLFKMPTNFGEEDLTKAKKLVLKTHPDKSGLSSEYFIFYSKAYKTLFGIWEFRKKGVNNKEKNTDYIIHEHEDAGKAKILDTFLKTEKMKDNKNFNQWFNKEFEKNKVHNESEQKGYGDWFKSEDDIDTENIKTKSLTEAKRLLDIKKAHLRNNSLIQYKEVEDGWSNSSLGGELDTDAPENYTSNMFSQLSYQDLHKAHTETVIPVTDEDYDIMPKFKNVEEYKSYRNNQNMTPLSDKMAEAYLTNKTKLQDEKSVRVAYELEKQIELSAQKNSQFWSQLSLLS
jgi:hypothetical protein